MTQFMIVKTCDCIDAPDGIWFRPIRKADDFLISVATYYFGILASSCAVVDRSGRVEPLVDDASDAQQAGRDIRDTAFVGLLLQLVRAGVEFVCWSGGDFKALPTVDSWADVLSELRSQTAIQPADFYIHFRPS
jgi:hypothetical protein